MKILNDLKNIVLLLFFIVLAIPILIVCAVIFIPFSIIYRFFDKRKRKKQLEEALLLNDGKIIFLYGAYHEFDFLPYFVTHHSDIKCLIIPNHYISDVFMEYLIKDRKPKSLPKLVKIDGENLITREHYNSFKHYIRRNNDADHFFELIDSSIKNLEKLPYKQL